MMFSIIRILGNELPPRDKIGNREKSLQYILDHEPEFNDCEKIWILNQIYDVGLLTSLHNMLHGSNVHVLQGQSNISKCKSYNEKIIKAININKARNYAIDIGSNYNFAFVLDGDCFFTKEMYHTIVSEIVSDQNENSDRKYYGIPMIRLINQKIPNKSHFDEVNLIFRNDSTYRFDESIPFGQNDKIELLQRLGYVCKNNTCINTKDICKTISPCLHISYNNAISENDFKHRMKLRNQSLKDFIYSLEPKIIL